MVEIPQFHIWHMCGESPSSNYTTYVNRGCMYTSKQYHFLRVNVHLDYFSEVFSLRIRE